MAFDRGFAAAERDLDVLGRRALDPRQQVGVGAQLDEGAGPDLVGQLGVGDLVAPGPEGARLLDAQQEVRVPEPAAVEERRLVDDVVAATDRGLGLGDLAPQPIASRGGAAVRVRPARVRFDAGHPATHRNEPLEIPGLVLEAALADEVQLRVGANRPWSARQSPPARGS